MKWIDVNDEDHPKRIAMLGELRPRNTTKEPTAVSPESSLENDPPVAANLAAGSVEDGEVDGR